VRAETQTPENDGTGQDPGHHFDPKEGHRELMLTNHDSRLRTDTIHACPREIHGGPVLLSDQSAGHPLSQEATAYQHVADQEDDDDHPCGPLRVGPQNPSEDQTAHNWSRKERAERCVPKVGEHPLGALADVQRHQDDQHDG
jgi:hypothetical protein